MCDGKEQTGAHQPSSQMTNEEAVGCLLFVVLGFAALMGYAIYSTYEQGWERRNEWEGYAARNPEVEIVGIVQKQYGPNKWNATQLVVEVRGTKTGETRIIREKDDYVPFNHLPQVGQIWRVWIENGNGRASYCFIFRMEPVSTAGKQP